MVSIRWKTQRPAQFWELCEIPVFKKAPDCAKVYELLVPPELHLMTGALNRNIHEVKKFEPDVEQNWTRTVAVSHRFVDRLLSAEPGFLEYGDSTTVMW